MWGDYSKAQCLCLVTNKCQSAALLGQLVCSSKTAPGQSISFVCQWHGDKEAII